MPHFEKMLYDQAQLALAYLEAAPGHGRRGFRRRGRRHAALRPARDDGPGAGGSIRPRTPTASRRRDAATPGRARRKAPSTCGRRMKSTRCSARMPRSCGRGSASSRTAMRRTTRTVSSRGRTCSTSRRRLARVAADHGLGVPEAERRARQRARQAMYERACRAPRPQLDDKILTAWNGLMIAAFARGVPRAAQRRTISTRPGGPLGS